jgi:hypothetical protein
VATVPEIGTVAARACVLHNSKGFWFAALYAATSKATVQQGAVRIISAEAGRCVEDRVAAVVVLPHFHGGSDRVHAQRTGRPQCAPSPPAPALA